MASHGVGGVGGVRPSGAVRRLGRWSAAQLRVRVAHRRVPRNVRRGVGGAFQYDGPNQALQWTPPSHPVLSLIGPLLPRGWLGGATELGRSADALSRGADRIAGQRVTELCCPVEMNDYLIQP